MMAQGPSVDNYSNKGNYKPNINMKPIILQDIHVTVKEENSRYKYHRGKRSGL